jgi:hypothetical protein
MADVLLFVSTAAAWHYYYSATTRSSSQTSITPAVLQEQNAVTSNAIIELYRNDTAFRLLAETEGALTQQRDAEDDDKLLQGIRFAQQKGVIDPAYVPEPYKTIDVLGKTPEQVANTILQQVNNDAKTTSSGSIIVLVGLSGTGKGTSYISS